MKFVWRSLGGSLSSAPNGAYLVWHPFPETQIIRIFRSSFLNESNKSVTKVSTCIERESEKRLVTKPRRAEKKGFIRENVVFSL